MLPDVWAVALLVLGVLLLVGALRLRQQSGLPWARVVASDTGTRLHRPLYAPRYHLTGKPDYVLQQGAYLIPVEVKPTRTATVPYESDLLQLAAYCLLIAETSDHAPPYGLLRYAEHTFRLDYTPAVEAELLAVLAAMRDGLRARTQHRSHDDPARCAACSFATQCDEVLPGSF